VSKSNTFENDILQLIFNNVDIANIGDAGGLQNSSSAGNLYVALHTADPGEAGTAATSEATYTNYERVAVARSAGGWTVSGSSVTNTAQITFPQCGASGNTITHASITVGGTKTTADKILYSGELSSPLAVANQITPFFASSTGVTVTED
jgi:hypothetical protein